MRKLVFLLLGIAIGQAQQAQIITCKPTFPRPGDSVEIIYNAALGNGGLKGYTGDVYAHTGVITSSSTSPSDWKHAPTWGDNSPKYKLTRIGTDLYRLVIRPSINAYYGIGTNEQVLQLAFVFRSADKTKEGKTETNGDIFYPVVNDTLIRILMLSPANMRNLVKSGDRIPVWVAFSQNDSVHLIENGSLRKTLLQVTEYRDTLEVNQEGKTRVKFTVYKGSAVKSDSFYYFVPCRCS